MHFFTELGLANISKPFDGMAVGTFRTAQGEVKIAPEELDNYLANTKGVLESTKTESGEIVGLPIDMDGHDHKGGAGWIVDIVRVGDLLRFVPKWTEAGEKLIRNGERRFFSPSFDAEGKVIIGGSMTNYPASRDEKRRMKLRPVELSESMFYTEYEDSGIVHEIYQILGSIKETFSTLSQAKPESDNKNSNHKGGTTMPTKLAELAANAGTDEGLAELTKYMNDQTNARVTELLEAEGRKQRIAELADTLVGGSKDHPKGLPVDKDKLVEFMTGLTAEQAKTAEAIFKAVQEKGFIDFEEEGHDKELEGHTELPEWADLLLTQHVAEGGKIKEFFATNQDELGEMKSYDLSEYKEKEGE